jgi:hypothetical protein
MKLSSQNNASSLEVNSLSIWASHALSNINFTCGPDFLISNKENKFYKMAMYPHCFYKSKDNVLKSIDYYSVVPYDERYIERKVIEGIIGKDGAYRFDESTDNNGYIDFKIASFFIAHLKGCLINFI